MKTEYVCPFCDEQLPKEEMQFHVSIPLCIKQRKSKAKQVYLKDALGRPFPVPKQDYEYFGDKGIRSLMAYTIQRLTLGHPDEGKPIDLESFIDHSED